MTKLLGALMLLTLLPAPSAHAAPEDFVYWTDAKEVPPRAPGLYRASTRTGVAELVAPSLSATGLGYDAVNQKLYWVQRIGEEQIFRTNLDGSDLETVTDELGDTRGVAVDPLGGKVYWAPASRAEIRRANLDGSEPEVIYQGQLGETTWDVAVDPGGGKVYWTTLNQGSIRRADLDGGNVEEILTGLARPFGLTLDLENGLVYWTASEADKIQRANLDGSDVVDVVTSAGSGLGLLGIAVDPGRHVYWVDRTNDSIRRANLRNGKVDTLVSGLVSPWDVVFVPEPEQVDGDLGTDLCRAVQLEAQDAGRAVRNATSVTSRAVSEGTISGPCASCIVRQVARRLPPEDQAPCGPTCGDGLLEPERGEECDDGNNAGNDGCSATCEIQSLCPCSEGYGEWITHLTTEPHVPQFTSCGYDPVLGAGEIFSFFRPMPPLTDHFDDAAASEGGACFAQETFTLYTFERITPAEQEICAQELKARLVEAGLLVADACDLSPP